MCCVFGDELSIIENKINDDTDDNEKNYWTNAEHQDGVETAGDAGAAAKILLNDSKHLSTRLVSHSRFSTTFAGASEAITDTGTHFRFI